MKWYLALNEESLKSQPHYADFVRVAVTSAFRNTSLHPYLLWDGNEESDFVKSLSKLGVKIVPCVSRYKKLICHHLPSNIKWRQVALGTWLRIEIAQIEQQDDFILYTDCDVVFLKNPNIDSFKPRLLSVAPEFDVGDYAGFNSGVMILNTAGMRSEQHEFDLFVADHFDKFMAFEQGALQEFFREKIDYLPPILNWKPYWGLAPSIEILHYHIKPFAIKAICESTSNQSFGLYRRAPQFSEMAAAYWYKLLDDCSPQFSVNKLPTGKFWHPSWLRPEKWPPNFDGFAYLFNNARALRKRIDPFYHSQHYHERESDVWHKQALRQIRRNAKKLWRFFRRRTL